MTDGIEQKKFLLIDDDALFRKILKKRLSDFFAPHSPLFDEAENLAEACNLINLQTEKPYDLIIIDQNLPDGLGNDFLARGALSNLAVILMSSDDSPELPGSAMRSGATYFLPKSLISERFVKSLFMGVIESNRLKNMLIESEIQLGIIDSVKSLVATLKHEINNPLGAVFGATFLLKASNLSEEERIKFIDLVETSSKKIKEVVDKILLMIENDNLKARKNKQSKLLKLN